MERDCCRQMHGKCGEVAMRGCCQVEVGGYLNQLPAHVVMAPVLRLTIIAMVYPLLVYTPALAGYRWHIPEEHSPARATDRRNDRSSDLIRSPANDLHVPACLRFVGTKEPS